MNYSLAYPYQSFNQTYINLPNYSPTTFISPLLNQYDAMPPHSLASSTLVGANLLGFNPLLFQAQPEYLLIQQQKQLEALLQTKQQILINQIQNIQLVGQTQNMSSVKKIMQNKDMELNLSTLFPCKDPNEIKEEPSSCSTEDSFPEISRVISQNEGQTFSKHKITNNMLRSQVEEIVWFLIKELGKAESKTILLQREIYADSKVLLHVFDALSSKYTSSGKCREDMTRFVLRKAISYLRNCERDRKGLSCKAASLVLCKKYFEIDSEEIAQNINIESEEELLNFLLPYKKGSRNRTANSSFITEIFESEAFRVDYGEFLNKLDDILQKENQSKLKKLVDQIMKCIKEDKISSLQNFKRLPWLESWLKATKLIAEELRGSNSWKEMNKTVKGEMKKSKS